MGSGTDNIEEFMSDAPVRKHVHAELYKQLAQDTKKELEALKAQVAKLEAAINEPEVVYGRQRVAKGEWFWFISDEGSVISIPDLRDEISSWSFTSGNYYHTKAYATKARDKQLAYMRIVDVLAEQNGDWVVDWGDAGQRKYYIVFMHDIDNGSFIADWAVQGQCNGSIYATKEACYYVIDNMEDDLKLVWGIE